MIVILKSIFKNYPDKFKQERVAKKEREEMVKNHQASMSDLQLAGQGVYSNGSAKDLSTIHNQYDMQNIIKYQLNQNSDREGFISEHNIKSDHIKFTHK